MFYMFYMRLIKILLDEFCAIYVIVRTFHFIKLSKEAENFVKDNHETMI